MWLDFKDEPTIGVASCFLKILLQGRDDFSVLQPVIHNRGKGSILNTDAPYCGVVINDRHAICREPHIELTAPAAYFGCFLQRGNRVFRTPLCAPKPAMSYYARLRNAENCAEYKMY
jgi:hypothetical protein